jgi:hypothetical protein
MHGAPFKSMLTVTGVIPSSPPAFHDFAPDELPTKYETGRFMLILRIREGERNERFRSQLAQPRSTVPISPPRVPSVYLDRIQPSRVGSYGRFTALFCHEAGSLRQLLAEVLLFRRKRISR